MDDEKKLASLILAPYIMKATALIGKQRKVGGNQFRHSMATLAILLDYKYFNNPVLLKASVVHDLLEEIPETDINSIISIDSDGSKVADLVLEVTKSKHEPKWIFLKRILETGSCNAKILKVADRISNLTDLNCNVFSKIKIVNYLVDTMKYIIPMAQEVNSNMLMELKDMIKVRTEMLDIDEITVTKDDFCPQCGNKKLIFIEGDLFCSECGFIKCG